MDAHSGVPIPRRTRWPSAARIVTVIPSPITMPSPLLRLRTNIELPLDRVLRYRSIARMSTSRVTSHGWLFFSQSKPSAEEQGDHSRSKSNGGIARFLRLLLAVVDLGGLNREKPRVAAPLGALCDIAQAGRSGTVLRSWRSPICREQTLAPRPEPIPQAVRPSRSIIAGTLGSCSGRPRSRKRWLFECKRHATVAVALDEDPDGMRSGPHRSG